MSIEMIIMSVVTAVVIPVFAPMLMDALACTTIWIMNITKGRPTWKVGTVFTSIVWPSGHQELDARIISVSFSRITLSTKHGYLAIKKRAMRGVLCTTKPYPVK